MPNPVPLEDNLATRLAALELRLDNLERAGRSSVGIANGGSVLLTVDEDGWSVPVITSPWRKFGDNFVTSSGSFVTAYRTNLRNLLGAGLIVDTFITVAASTTAEVRLNLAGTTTVAAGFGAGSFAVAFRWAHGLALGGNGVNRQLDVEVRRVTGAGTVTLDEPQPPTIATVVTGITLTPTGL